jgi:Fe-S-cluster containining protein
MEFVPWQDIADWKCNGCGDCCRLYTVVLSFYEWLRIVKSYGIEQTASGLNELYIRRRSDGSCAFLQSFPNLCTCGLQYVKPKACQIWPFKVMTEPKFGSGSKALYNNGNGSLFVYADSTCSGLKYGTPTWEFINTTLKEFVDISLGLRQDQCKTTANLGLPRRVAYRKGFPRHL